ncbi:hypothetical protein THASP1DRAFT_21544 [Thamnocephalis sphaerospora]|uniref:Uncharacterized protein n=1 Tax=Thamnocephalis sphaerospora TaxID=78915 RepID=A0A4P9XWS2_9FUNG|nr:hypothetical protein THASP1DRAFT_21544 [Thamnocephalis sphaerospora]|eukprot:RKP10776.1 hypothetical protein THASP1DRAFT_21544 [Thamnocephalis sphaerospora]
MDDAKQSAADNGEQSSHEKQSRIILELVDETRSFELLQDMLSEDQVLQTLATSTASSLANGQTTTRDFALGHAAEAATPIRIRVAATLTYNATETRLDIVLSEASQASQASPTPQESDNASTLTKPIQAAEDPSHKPIYIGRTYHYGLQPGLVEKDAGGLVFGYAGRRHRVEEYEVFCADPAQLSWRLCHERLRIDGWYPVPAGCDSDGSTLYIARCAINGREYIGKISSHLPRMHYVDDRKEQLIPGYEVLVYTDRPSTYPDNLERNLAEYRNQYVNYYSDDADDDDNDYGYTDDDYSAYDEFYIDDDNDYYVSGDYDYYDL